MLYCIAEWYYSIVYGMKKVLASNLHDIVTFKGTCMYCAMMFLHAVAQ